MHETDYYELLGVPANASAAEIKSAYRALVRSLHPDAGGEESTFQRLHEAYETLYDPSRRSRYDRWRATAARSDLPTSTPRPSTDPARHGAQRRRMAFGEDPDFVAALPRIEIETVPWWHETDPAQRVHKSGQPTTGHAPLLVVFAGLLVLLIPAALPVEFVAMLAVWLLVALVSGGVSLWLAHRLLSATRLERELHAEFGSGRVYGRVGEEPDQWNERLTADLLSAYLTWLPGARVFHGLTLPGSVFADIDHAVLRGNRLVLIESKAWLPGHYTAPDGVLTRNGQRFRGGATGLGESVPAFRALLPDIEVCGAIVIYPSRAGEISTAGQPPARATPTTPERFVRDIGDWLAAAPPTVDVPALRAVFGQLG